MRDGKPSDSGAGEQSTLFSAIATVVVCVLLAATGLSALEHGAPSSAGSQHTTSRNQPQAPQILFVQQPCTPVYATPTAGSTLLTQLLGGTDITALEQTSAAG